MIHVFGHRLFGRIDECGSTHLATRFFHTWWLPLIPVETVLVLSQGGAQYRFYPQSLSGRSLLAALLRTWGVVLTLFPGIPLMHGALTGSHAHAGPVMLWFVLNLAAVVYAYSGLGKLSAAERGQRMVYASFVEYPVDVARVGRLLPDLRGNLRSELDRLARAQGQGANRGALMGQFDHLARAADSHMLDVDYLRSALVLARLEWAETRGPERAKRAAHHAAIWAKLARMNAASASGQGPERRVPQREWVDLGAQAAVTPPAAEQESQVPEREWVDLAPTTVDAPATEPEKRAFQPKAAGGDASAPPLARGRATATPLAAPRPVRSHSAVKPASRPQRSSGAMVGVIVVCVALGLVGLGVVRGYHKRMLARDTVDSNQGDREAKLQDVRLPEAKPPSDLAPCHLNAPRTWKVTVNKEEDTPFKSLTLVNPSGDMNLRVVMRPQDAASATEGEMASKAAAQRADKNTLVDDGWLDLPVQRVWREVRNLPAEEPALTEVNYFIRKPAFDVLVRAHLPALRFPQFRKFIEDIMQSVYCDEPVKAPAGTP